MPSRPRRGRGRAGQRLLPGLLAAAPLAMLGSPAAAKEPRDPAPEIALDLTLQPTVRWTGCEGGNAPTPPMGWNSYNAFNLDIDKAKVLASAELILASGLAAKGHRYIDLDEGWWGGATPMAAWWCARRNSRPRSKPMAPPASARSPIASTP